MQGLRAWWDNLTPDKKDFYSDTGSGLVVIIIGAIAVGFRASIGALYRRVFKSKRGNSAPETQPPAPPTPQPIIIEVRTPTAPPAEPAEPAKPVEVSPPAPSPRFPRPPKTGFVARRDTEGREILERLIKGLAPGKQQLLALCGDGGWGKTTLAAEAVRALSDAFARRIAWVSADGRPDFTLSTLLDGVAEQLSRPELRQFPVEQKKELLHTLVATPPTLVVLDNFETIAAEERARCADWLDQAACSAVITSRGEVPSATPINISAMSPPEAREFVNLLIGQARHPQSFEELDHDRIINAADRNPLVLQWIIKQIDKAMQPGAVLSELTRGKGDAAVRVFGRSFGLLSEDGRAALLALSLFVPGASRAALAEVAGFGADAARLDAAAGQLAELWLVNTTEGNARLTVEGLTRELAKSRLAGDAVVAEFRQRFVAYFLGYAQAHAQTTPEDFDALEAERENLLAAMDAAFEGQQWQEVMTITNALWQFLKVRGYWDEAVRRGQQAVEAAHAMKDKGPVAVFATNIAIIRQNLGEYSEAKEALSQAVVAFKELGEDQNVAAVLHQQGRLAQAQGDIDEARKLYGESLETNKRLGNQSGIASTLNQLAALAQAQGDIDEARKLYGESLEIKRRLGDQSGIAISLHGLGGLAEEEGNKAEAARMFRESLSLFEKLGSPNAEIARQNLKRLESEDS